MKKIVIHGIRNHMSIAWFIMLALIRHGFDVYLGVENDKYVDRVKRMLEKEDPELVKHVRHIGICDVLDEGENGIEAFYGQIAQVAGTIDGIVHGIVYGTINKPLLEVTREEYLRTIEITALSVQQIARAALPLLNDRSKIIALTYEPGTNYIPGYPAPGSAKAAMAALMRSLGFEFPALHGKRVLTVTLDLPPQDTVSAKAIAGMAEMREAVAKASPLGETTKEQVGEFVTLIYDDRWSMATGVVVSFDGGAHLLEGIRFESEQPPTVGLGN